MVISPGLQASAAAEIARFSRLFGKIEGGVLARAAVDAGGAPLAAGEDACRLVVLDEALGRGTDVQAALVAAKAGLSRFDRIAAVMPREGRLARATFAHLAELSGYELVRLVPLWGGATRALRAFPGLAALAPGELAILRPVVRTEARPRLGVVVPARNERGNIAAAIAGLEALSDIVGEVVFVEGHSHDDTWGEIQRQIAAHKGRVTFKALQQTGKGKKDAVRLGFSVLTTELITILDADLTVPAPMLRRFYDAWCEGLGDFINGNRLVYPMEDEAMRFLNWIGNRFFAGALSYGLSCRIGDSLCGTKLLARRHYAIVERWRRDFGDFDPFGDFELLFPAASLGLGVVDLPVRYLARTYGSTNIQRFRDGLRLLRMTVRGALLVRMGGRATTETGSAAAVRIRAKRALRAFYDAAYSKFAACLARCPKDGVAVELGSGAGYLKERLPEVVTSDVAPGPGIDRVDDARALGFPDASLRAIFMLNVFHHVPDVERFLAEAVRCLKPGGRVFLVDQHHGWLARLAHRWHHEPFRPEAQTWAFPSVDPQTDANGALTWIVFRRDVERLAAHYPDLKLVRYEPHTPLLYWLSGGLKRWTLAPGPLASMAIRLDRLVHKLIPSSACFVDVELERLPATAPGSRTG